MILETSNHFKMSFIYDIIDVIDNTISTPSPKVEIEFPEILDAYFAKKNVEPEYEESVEEYTVRRGDSLSRIANRYRDERNDSNITVENIKNDNGLQNNTIHPGDVLRIRGREIVGERISFEYINKGSIGQEVYIVVETVYFRGNTIKINVKQGVESVLAEVDSPIQVTQDNNSIVLIETNVGEFADNEDITNKDDFRDWAIVKIELRPDDTNVQTWTDAIADTGDKKALLYLLVDAHSGNSEYDADRIIYYGRNPDEEGNPDTDSIRNHWLDMEGKWFELIGARAPWMEIALEEAQKARGVIEEEEPMYSIAESYLRFVGNRFEPTDSLRGPWCAAFMNWCIHRSGFRYAESASSLAPISPEYSRNFREIAEPVYGCIVVYKHVTEWKGHTGFLYGMSATGEYILLGGNQDNTIKFANYGEYTSRSRQKRLHGFYIPEDYTITQSDYLTSEDDNLDVDSENRRYGIASTGNEGRT